MRLFTNLDEAASEIKRDIAKSPIVKSSRVQNILQESQVYEALDYSYSVIEMPRTKTEIFDLGIKQQFWKEEDRGMLVPWLDGERAVRLNWQPGTILEKLHPHLKHLVAPIGSWGKEPEYTYTDRLRDSIPATATVLINDPSSRRAYWPLFHVEDAVRATRVVRIPCSTSYHPLIREVNGQPYLHLTYTERSCDFNKFWLTDIWLARQWQLELLYHLKGVPHLKGIQCGNTTHFITSFHAFIDDEVY